MSYEERIKEIGKACDEIGIPYIERPCFEGWQICFSWLNGGADIACHDHTYGAQHGCVESYKCPWDNGDVTVLTVGEAIGKVVKAWLNWKEK